MKDLYDCKLGLLKSSPKILLLLGFVLLLSGCHSVGWKSFPNMLQNLYDQLAALWQFLFALSYTLGVCFVVLAIMKLKQYGQMTVMMSTQASMGACIAYLLVGAGLLFLPTFLDTLSWTFWGQGHAALMANAEANSVNFSEVIQPIFRLVMVLGLISLIRGCVTLIKLGTQGAPPGTLGKGLIHMLGGIAAININGTIQVLRETFGVV